MPMDRGLQKIGILPFWQILTAVRDFWSAAQGLTNDLCAEGVTVGGIKLLAVVKL